MARPLPYPDWNTNFAEELEGVPIVDMKLVASPKRHYCVTFENDIRLAFHDSPSKVVGATEDKPGIAWWAAGLAADYLLDNAGQMTADHFAYGEEEWQEKRSAWYDLARKQHDVQKREAAKTGSSVHEFIERALKAVMYNLPLLSNTPGISDQVFAGIAAFEQWWKENGFHPVAIEEPTCHVWLGYAGTIDVVAMNSMGDLLLVDWKTSKSLHASYWRQLGAYWLARNHMQPDEPVTGAHLVRLGKEGEDAGKFETHYLDWSDLEQAAQAFEDSLSLYRYTEKINQRLKKETHR